MDDAAMPVDDLQRPLGTPRRRRQTGSSRGVALPKWVRRLPLLPLTALAAALSLAGVVGWAVVVDDPLGGEPVARVAISQPAGSAAAPAAAPPAVSPPPPPTAVGAEPPPAAAAPVISTAPSVNVIDGRSGQASEVKVGPSEDGALAPAPDPRLTEKTRHGTVPRIGDDGARALEVYARPAPAIPPGRTDMPRVAVVIGGLGISASTTSEAIAKLPPEVSLGFLPYGADLDRVVGRARAAGHEVLLQVPMEPLDYPENDPGPLTLLTTLTGDQNVDRLLWFMSRFPGFIGIAPYMGARFTATERALAPVMREVSRRGLMYFDDGTSQRSASRELAGGLGAPLAWADVALDTTASPAEIDGALSRLERIARERGSALGVATALPVSIERLARWAKEAESRGFILVPLSAVVGAGKKGA